MLPSFQKGDCLDKEIQQRKTSTSIKHMNKLMKLLKNWALGLLIWYRFAFFYFLKRN